MADRVGPGAPAVDRRAAVRLLGAGTAAALVPLVPLLAACGPVQVTATGGPAGRTASPAAPPTSSTSRTPPASPSVGASGSGSSTPSPAATASPSPTVSTASATPTASASPAPVPTVPPLVSDLTSLDGAFLLFLAPSPAAGWRKTLGTTVGQDIRTFYDDDAQSLHMIVEVVAPLGISPLAHARRLAAAERAREPGYAERVIGPGPAGGAVWAFTYPSASRGQRYGIDWFQVFPAFDAAVYVEGPEEAADVVRALWRAVVDSVTLPTPYQSRSGALQRQLTGVATASATPGSSTP